MCEINMCLREQQEVNGLCHVTCHVTCHVIPRQHEAIIQYTYEPTLTPEPKNGIFSPKTECLSDYFFIA